MDGNGNQELPIRVEPPAQSVGKAEAAAPVEQKPAEEQSGSADEEQLARQRQMIENLKNAGLINEEPPIPSPETPSAETIKPRQSIFAALKAGIINLFHLLTLNLFRKRQTA